MPLAHYLDNLILQQNLAKIITNSIKQLCENSQEIRNRAQLAIRKFMLDMLQYHGRTSFDDLPQFITDLEKVLTQLQTFVYQIVTKVANPDGPHNFGILFQFYQLC
jgi:uncharacterized protein with von Willebrand factor type A (vWA) domain